MKRGLKILLLIIIFITIVMILSFLLLCYVIKPEIKQVIVHNNKILDKNTIVDLANIDKDENYILINNKKIIKNIKSDEIVKDVKIKRNINLEYHIYVYEYKPLFIREDINKLVLENKKEIDIKDYYNVNVPRVVNYIPDKVYLKLIKKINELDNIILEKISDIKYYPNKYDEERFILYMNDKNLVYINLPKFKNINEYNKMVEKFGGKTGKLYLDSGNYFEYAKDKKIDTKDNSKDKNKKEENKKKEN